MKNSELIEHLDSVSNRINSAMSDLQRNLEVSTATLKILTEIALRLPDKESALAEAENLKKLPINKPNNAPLHDDSEQDLSSPKKANKK